MTKPDKEQFTVKLNRRMRGSAECAFAALTRADLLSRWFTKSAEIDLRVGGRYKNSDRDEGEYLVIDAPHRLHFTWENAGHCPGTVVEIGFESQGDGTVEVTLEHRGIETREGSADMHRGWSWALDSLKSFLERGVPVPYEQWETTHPLEK